MIESRYKKFYLKLGGKHERIQEFYGLLGLFY